MSETIDVTVAAVIERNQQFLIVEEHVGNERVFNQPAGHLEPGESLCEAVVREVLEETGFGFEPTAIIGVSLWRHPERTFLRVTFTGDARAPVARPTLDQGIIATHWLSRQELVQRDLRSPLVLQCIDAYLRGERYPLALLTSLELDSEAIAKRA